MVRDQDHDRLPFCVLQLDSYSVRIGEADIGNYGDGTQCVSFGSEALNESLQDGDAAWLLALSRVASHMLRFAGRTHRKGVREELTMFLQHLSSKRQ